MRAPPVFDVSAMFLRSCLDFRHRASGQPWLELEKLPEVCAKGRAVRLSSSICVAKIERTDVTDLLSPPLSRSRSLTYPYTKGMSGGRVRRSIVIMLKRPSSHSLRPILRCPCLRISKDPQ